MSISKARPLEDITAVSLRSTGDHLYVTLDDGREVSISIERVAWLNWLRKVTPDQRQEWSLEPGGYAFYWDRLDNGFEVCHLLEELDRPR